MKTLTLCFLATLLTTAMANASANGLRCNALLSPGAKPARSNLKQEKKVSTSIATSAKSYGREALTEVDREAFIARAKKGDVDPKLGKNALVVAEELTRQMREPVLGPGIRTCYGKFGPAAVSTVHRLIIASRGAMNPHELHSKIVATYSKIFDLSKKESERRVCTLADHGPIASPECGIFGAAVAADCRF